MGKKRFSLGLSFTHSLSHSHSHSHTFLICVYSCEPTAKTELKQQPCDYKVLGVIKLTSHDMPCDKTVPRTLHVLVR
jgi:hypothetical protein